MIGFTPTTHIKNMETQPKLERLAESITQLSELQIA